MRVSAKLTCLMAAVVLFGLIRCVLASPVQNQLTKMPVIIDTDMGFDDWVGILYLLKNPKIDVKAITLATTGETHCMTGLAHLKYLFSIVGSKNIPIACGVAKPLKGNRHFPKFIRKISDDMNGMPVPKYKVARPKETAAQLIVRTIHQAKQPVTIVELSPLTNIALALQLDSSIGHKIKMLYISGGAINRPGNLNIPGATTSPNKVSEWNLFIDPVADAIVFKSNIPITLVPLNCTSMAPLTDQYVADLHKVMHTPAMKFLYRDLVSLKRILGGRYMGAAMYDAVTSVIASEPSVANLYDMRICINDSDKNHIGQTYACKSAKQIRVALSLKTRSYRSQLRYVMNNRLVKIN